jgi:hypothetical protein
VTVKRRPCLCAITGRSLRKADEKADPIMKTYVRKHIKTAIGETAASNLYDVMDGKIDKEIQRIVKLKGMKIHNWCDFEGVST